MKIDYSYSVCVQEKAELLQKVYSSNEIEVDTFDINFSGPEYGWLEAEIIINGESRYTILMSDVYPPFKDLVRWLEDIYEHWNIPSKTVGINNESFNVFLSFDYLGRIDEIEEHVGLFTIGEEWDHIVLSFVAPIAKVVKTIYLKLRRYVLKHQTEFRREWDDTHWDHIDPRKLLRQVSSPVFEKGWCHKDIYG